MLPEQALDTLEYSWVVINDQNEVSDLASRYPDCPPTVFLLAKTKAPDPFREPYAISEGLPGARRSTRSTREPVPSKTEFCSIGRAFDRTRDVCSCCWLFA